MGMQLNAMRQVHYEMGSQPKGGKQFLFLLLTYSNSDACPPPLCLSQGVHWHNPRVVPTKTYPRREQTGRTRTYNVCLLKTYPTEPGTRRRSRYHLFHSSYEIGIPALPRWRIFHWMTAGMHRKKWHKGDENEEPPTCTDCHIRRPCPYMSEQSTSLDESAQLHRAAFSSYPCTASVGESR